jgi:hypothetical protein
MVAPESIIILQRFRRRPFLTLSFFADDVAQELLPMTLPYRIRKRETKEAMLTATALACVTERWLFDERQGLFR